MLEQLINCLVQPSLMAYPDFNSPYILHTDTSETGLGTVLYQHQNGLLRVIAYGSRTLTPAEKNYHLHSGKLEFLALKWAICDQFRDYLYHAPSFTIYTDNNPLTYVLTSAKLNATGLCWIGELADFTFDIKYRPGTSHIDADTLSQLPFESYMRECTEETSPETLQAIVTSVQAQAHGDNNWLSSFSHDSTLVDADIKLLKKPVASQFKSIDMKAAQLSDPVIGKVMKYLSQVTSLQEKKCSRRVQ